MKSFAVIATILLGLGVATAGAAEKATLKKKVVTQSKRLTPKTNLQREVVFDGSTVNGQYHAAGEAVAKVEQEKKMNDLIGMRRDFKDRLTAEKERLKRGDTTETE